MMGGARLWARAVLRRRRAATLFLAVFAGIAGGLVMTAAGVARRTSSSLERYLDQADLATHLVIACPVGMTEEQIGGDPGNVCGKVDDVMDVADALSRSPAIERVVPTAALVTGVRAGPSEPWSPTIQYAVIGQWPGLPSSPVVAEGRLPRADASDEAALNESLASQLGVRAGDTIDVATYRADERFDAVSDGEQSVPGGEIATLRIVGIVRAVDDVAPDPDPVLYTTAGWWSRYGSDDVAGYGKGVSIELADPDAIGGLDDALRDALPGRLFDVSDSLSSVDSTRRIIELQSAAAWAVALVAFVASIGFVGQTLARQLERDVVERHTLVGLGMTRRDLVVAQGLRLAPCAIGAAIIAGATSILASPVGPVGLGRKLEISPGIRVDMALVVVGSLAVMVITLIVPLTVASVTRHRRRGSRARMFVHPPGATPASVRAGLSLLRGDQASHAGAVIGTAVAVALAIVGISFAHSHAALVAHPNRFGQSWDITLGDFGSPDEVAAGRVAVAGVTGIAGLGSARSAVATIEGTPLFVVAFVGPDGTVGPTVLDGRVPDGDHEVALGTITMRRHGLSIGDVVSLVSPIDREVVGPLTVVGRVVLNDGVDAAESLGDGALVTEAVFDAVDPNSLGQSLLIRAAHDVDPSQLVVRLQAVFGGSVELARSPEDVTNLDRVAAAPVMIAVLVALLAGSAMVNKLITLLARRRRDTAVLRSLGFTPRQVLATTLTVATALAASAAAIGVPVGVIAARWGWGAVETRLGIESGVVVPPGGVAAVVAGTILLAQLAAVVPGVRAARQHPAVALAAQ